MIILFRFLIYAVKFEIAYRNNKWKGVKNCFHSNACYQVIALPPFEGVWEGNENIIAAFIKSTNEFDKMFTQRIPRLSQFPHVKRNTVSIEWKVKYIINHEPPFVMKGTSEIQFHKGKISMLIDRIAIEVCEVAKKYHSKFNPNN